MALNARQQAFVEAYTGNATEAARRAGYTGSDATLASTADRLMRKNEVLEAIKARQGRATTKRIATLDELQALWTEVAFAAGEEMAHRLKASELLGRSMAAFVEKVKLEGKMTWVEALEEVERRRKERLQAGAEASLAR